MLNDNTLLRLISLFNYSSLNYAFDNDLILNIHYSIRFLGIKMCFCKIRDHK